jgi:large subunit ribosomal protein L22
MARSVWKGPFVDGYLLKKAEKARESGRNDVIKIWSRRSTIMPQFVGLTFGVYNGTKHSGRRVRRHGGPQVWRIRADADLLRPRRRQEGEEEVTMGKPRLPAGWRTTRRVPSRARTFGSARRSSIWLRQLIRGKKVDAALADLTFSRKRIAATVKKTLESAIANAENNHDLDVDDLVVAEAYVGKSIVMKRFMARGRGRVGRIEKPFRISRSSCARSRRPPNGSED